MFQPFSTLGCEQLEPVSQQRSEFFKSPLKAGPLASQEMKRCGPRKKYGSQRVCVSMKWLLPSEELGPGSMLPEWQKSFSSAVVAFYPMNTKCKAPRASFKRRVKGLSSIQLVVCQSTLMRSWRYRFKHLPGWGSRTCVFCFLSKYPNNWVK